MSVSTIKEGLIVYCESCEMVNPYIYECFKCDIEFCESCEDQVEYDNDNSVCKECYLNEMGIE